MLRKKCKKRYIKFNFVKFYHAHRHNFFRIFLQNFPKKNVVWKKWKNCKKESIITHECDKTNQAWKKNHVKFYVVIILKYVTTRFNSHPLKCSFPRASSSNGFRNTLQGDDRKLYACTEWKCCDFPRYLYI